MTVCKNKKKYPKKKIESPTDYTKIPQTSTGQYFVEVFLYNLFQ
jgi:hypothetical protein